MIKDYNENASEIAGEDVVEVITDIKEAPSEEELNGCVNNLAVYNGVMLDKQKKSRMNIFLWTILKYQRDISNSTLHILKVIRHNCKL